MAVDGAGAMFFDGVAVQLCAVPFVTAEFIHGILWVKLNHQPVACDLGQNRCSGNTQAFAVTTHYSLLWQWDCRASNANFESGSGLTVVSKQQSVIIIAKEVF